MRRFIALLGIPVLLGVAIVPQVRASSLYGRDGYSTCEYSRDCPVTSTDTPVPATPEEPTQETPPVNTDIVISVANVKPGQVINVDKTVVIVNIDELFNDGSSEPISPDKVGWVILYVNEKQAGIQYNQENQGEYRIPWDLRKFPGTRLAIVAYDRQGVFLKRKDLVVMIAARFFETPRPSEAAAEPAPKVYFSKPVVVVAHTFPYWIFLILLIAAIRLWLQSVRELRTTERLRQLVTREHLVARLKDDFINLVSHYLRTASTTVAGGIELLQTNDGVVSGPLQALQRSGELLRQNVEQLVKRAQQGVSGDVVTSTTIALPVRPLRTLMFWIPVLGIILLSASTTVMLDRFTNVGFAPAELLAQAFSGLAVAIFFLLALRQSELKKTERTRINELVEHEKQLGESRNSLIEQVVYSLEQPVSQLTVNAQPFVGQQNGEFLVRGIGEIKHIISQFKLATLANSELLLGAPSNIGLLGIMQQAVSARTGTIEQKHLRITLPTSETRVMGDGRLINLVLDAIIDNAVKFSNEQGSINIIINEAEDVVTVAVQDNGIGISESKQSLLFQPFSRGSGTETFDYEGMGFSLFLCKLILAAIGGSIELASAEQEGTTVTITLPTNQNAQAASSK